MKSGLYALFGAGTISLAAASPVSASYRCPTRSYTHEYTVQPGDNLECIARGVIGSTASAPDLRAMMLQIAQYNPGAFGQDRFSGSGKQRIAKRDGLPDLVRAGAHVILPVQDRPYASLPPSEQAPSVSFVPPVASTPPAEAPRTIQRPDSEPHATWWPYAAALALAAGVAASWYTRSPRMPTGWDVRKIPLTELYAEAEVLDDNPGWFRARSPLRGVRTWYHGRVRDELVMALPVVDHTGTVRNDATLDWLRWKANKESGVPADLLCLLHPDMVKYRREQTAVRAVEDQREGRRILAKAFGSIEKAREHFAAQGLAVQGI